MNTIMNAHIGQQKIAFPTLSLNLDILPLDRKGKLRAAHGKEKNDLPRRLMSHSAVALV